MSLLNSNITEEIQGRIYDISILLGVKPTIIKSVLSIKYNEDDVQVNWIKGSKSYMWRSRLEMGGEMYWLEVYNGGDAHVTTVRIDDLEKETKSGVFLSQEEEDDYNAQNPPPRHYCLECGDDYEFNSETKVFDCKACR